MGLFVLVVILAVVAFWAGFRAPSHPWQYKSQAAFVVFVGLAVFTGYFAWREHRALGDLTRLIDPVPEITDVMYVPTSAEIQAIARAAATVPGEGRGGLGTTPDQRQVFSESLDRYEGRYWKLETKLAPERIAEYYRDARHRNGWDLTMDQIPWLGLVRGSEALTIFVQVDWKSPRTTVWYMYEPRS